jgi:hypothetical protein
MPLIYFLKNSTEIPRTHDGITMDYHNNYKPIMDLKRMHTLMDLMETYFGLQHGLKIILWTTMLELLLA